MDSAPQNPSPVPSRLRRFGAGLRRWVTTGVPLVLLLPVVLLIGENLFINTGLRLLLSLQPERVRVTWDGAMTLWPGDVEVWGLEVRVQDPGVQWIASFDNTTGHIDVWALLDYRFVAHSVHADGASIRARMVRATAATPEELVATPEIDGFTNPPTRSPEILYGPPPRYFRVELDNLLIEHVREIWVEDYRFVGDARLSGGLNLLAEEWLQLDDAGLDIARGELSLDGAPILRAMEGRVDATLTGMNPGAQTAQELMGYLTARVQVDADVQDIRFLEFYLRKAPWLRLTGGAGPLTLDLAVDQGRLQPGSRLGVDAAGLDVGILSYRVTGDGTVALVVEAVETGTESRLHVGFKDYALLCEDDTVPHVLGEGLSITATTADLSLAEAFERLDVSVVIPDSIIPDVRAYDRYIPREAGLTLLSGTGRAHGTFQASTADDVAHGDLFLETSSVTARLDNAQLAASVTLHAHLVEGHLAEGAYDMSGSELQLRDVSVVGAERTRQGKDNSYGWWADVALPRGRITVGAPVVFDASLELQCRDTVPFVSLFSQANPLPGWARGLLAVKGMSGEASLLIGDETFVLPRLALRGGPAEVLLKLRRVHEGYLGSLYARYGILSVGMALSGDESKLHLFEARDWYDDEPAP